MKTSVELFWDKVNKKHESGCWIWTAFTNPKGYGQVRIAGKAILAHRQSYIMAFGPIPNGLNVLHKCDTPACVRPDHLFLGTLQDNNHDMMLKGRYRQPIKKGEHFSKPRKGNKLTFTQVREIRTRYANEHLSHAQLSKAYGVSQGNISMIINHKRWNFD